MPTAGEAKLAKKNINERSTRKPIKKVGAGLSTGATVNKSGKTQNTRILIKKHGKENIEPKKRAMKAKPAPDFSKLHNNWNSKFQKGKAVAKKCNTKVSPFVLTEVQTQNPLSSKRNDSSDKENIEEEQEEDDFGFEIDNNALQGILNNTGIQVQEDFHPPTRNTYAGTAQKGISAPNTISGVSTKRTSIYYTGSKKTPTPQHQPLQTKGLTSNRPVFGFQAKLGKKQVAWADQDNDGTDEEISFKPDALALESILNNKGIDERQTRGARHTMASTRSVPFMQNSKRQSVIDSQSSKRTSIYYTGSKSKSITSDLPRPYLIGRPRTSFIDKPTVPFGQRTTMSPTLKQQYVPGSTVIGKQDEAMENKGFEIHTFVKPFTPSRQETISQVSKTTDVKSCIINPLTPCRGKSQDPSASSKKQVSWSDILTPHRDLDQVKPKDVILTAPMEQTEQVNYLRSSELADSSPWLMSATKPPYQYTRRESPADDDTVTIKLFSDGTEEETKQDRKEKLELEELERQAIEELQLLEVEENRTSKETCKGFNNNIQARLSNDISGCEPLTSPLQIFNTPRNLNTKDLTDQWLRATPQNHMRVTMRNKTPIASPLVTHLGTHRVLDSRYRPMASPRPLVNQASGFEDPTVHNAPKATFVVNQTSQSLIGVARPMESGIQVPAGYTAPKPTHFVSQTGALPVDKTGPFTPSQQVVQTPLMNGPLDNGQPFGLLSSIKKSGSKIGNKRPHSSSVASNASFPKSLSWSDTFYSSTPGIEVVTSSFQEQSSTSNEFTNYRRLPTNVYQPLNIRNPTIVRDKRFYNPSELPSSSNYGNDFKEPAEKPSTSNIYQPAKRSFTHHHGNAFQKPAGNDCFSLHCSKPAEKPFTSHYGNNSYMPAEKPLVSLNEKSLYGGNSSNRLSVGISGNYKVHSNGVSGLSWGGGHTQKASMSGHIPSSSKTDIAPLFASAPVATTNHIQSNGHAGSNSTYTSCLTMGKGTVVSIHSPGFIRQQPPLHSDTRFSSKPDILNTASIFNTSRIHPNNETLSLRSAVGPSGFHRREPIMILPEVTSTSHRTGEKTLPKENSTSYQNSVDVRLPRSIETRNTLAQEALLDTEVALYTTLGVRIKKKCTRDLSNPLAKIFEQGDSQHIVPICVCSDKIYCSVHPVLRSPILVRREYWK